MTVCPVCATPLGKPDHATAADVSVTSITTLLPFGFSLTVCRTCSFTLKKPHGSLTSFWNDYAVHMAATPMADRYTVDGRPVERVRHDADTILVRAAPPPGARLCMLGAGRGAVAERLLALRPDLDIHAQADHPLFAESLAAFLPSDRVMIGPVPPTWRGRFDTVVSLYDMAHTDAPGAAVSTMATLLKPAGSLLVSLPNPLATPVDLMVANHLGHYTAEAVGRLFAGHGFARIVVDAAVCPGRLLVTAQLSRSDGDAASPSPADAEPTAVARMVDACRGWSDFTNRIRAFERALPPDNRRIIYGAGVTGALTMAVLEHPQAVDAFVDGNPKMEGRIVFGRPVLSPDRIDSTVGAVFLALPPTIADQVARGNPGLSRPGLAVFKP